MGLETILILAATGMGIALLGVVVYRSTPSKVTTTKIEVKKEQLTAPKVLENEVSPQPEPVSEAPPPFSDDSTPSSPKRIAAPTDTTAIGSASPFLAIPLPKAAQRNTTRAKRKRRVPKSKTFPQDLGTAIPSIDPPSNKEPSAA